MVKPIKLIVPIFLILFFINACGTTVPPTLTPPTDQVKPPTEPTLVRATPTSIPSTAWSTYRNDTYGYAFEYPAAYDEASYKDSCGIKENNDGIHLGHQIDLLFLESNGLDLTEIANNFLKTKGWTSTSLINTTTTNGLEAITAEYRFGGLNRFGTFTLIKADTRIFALNFSAGNFCDIPEAHLSEPEIYSHILETFHLTAPITSNETAYEFRFKQFDAMTPFFVNASYPNELTSIDDVDLLPLGCSLDYFSWTGTDHEAIDPTTQQPTRISDSALKAFLASAQLLHPGQGITSISYCEVENEDPIVIYRVGGCGGGCAGIPNISIGAPDGSLALVTTIQDGTDGAYYGCTPLLMTKQHILYVACRGEGTGIIRKVDLINRTVEIVQSCIETSNGVECKQTLPN